MSYPAFTGYLYAASGVLNGGIRPAAHPYKCKMQIADKMLLAK
jgi:hypothetical protein